jgi:eukaryotic-like serine/threonine-protein kinase
MIESLGHYRILEPIGVDALGEIYRARDTLRGRTVAIRIVAPAIAGDPDRRARLTSDAQAAAAASHPNIATLYEIGEDQGTLFLASEFVPGETLQAAIAGRPLNPRRAIDLAVQIADALADAHAAMLEHGRLAADTIVVTPKGHAKILELGLAAWTRPQAPADTSRPQGDVFSLGAVLFEMLAGRPPLAGEIAAGNAANALLARSPDRSNAIPGELAAIVSRALSADSDRRYESIATMAAELREAAAVLDARDTSEPQHIVRAAHAPRRRSFAGVGVLVLSIAVAAAAWWQRDAIARAWRHATGPAPQPILAVMPLTLVDTDDSQMFFADGLTEDLITRLGQTPGIRVLGRAAVRASRTRAPREVAGDLGAAAVLTGTLHRVNDQVTVALALGDPADGASLWSNEYTRAVKEIFALQAQAAEDVAQALHLPLQLNAETARTSSRQIDPAAYELYLRGGQAAAEAQPAAAVKYYQAATAADDGLPDAFAGLARALTAGATVSKSDDAARRERIRMAAERAYQLDPDLASANVAMALAAPSLSQALQYLKRAIDLDPSNGDSYRDVSDVIRTAAPDLSAAFDRRAAELDPRAAGRHTPIPEWRPTASGRQNRAEAMARDREEARRLLAGVLDARQ